MFNGGLVRHNPCGVRHLSRTSLRAAQKGRSYYTSSVDGMGRGDIFAMEEPEMLVEHPDSERFPPRERGLVMHRAMLREAPRTG